MSKLVKIDLRGLKVPSIDDVTQPDIYSFSKDQFESALLVGSNVSVNVKYLDNRVLLQLVNTSVAEEVFNNIIEQMEED